MSDDAHMAQAACSSSPIFFEGPIPDAISFAQRTCKLFIVYIAGDNEESRNLEATTWSNSQVAALIKEHAVALRLQQNTADAAQFSALYPVASVPNITIVGCDGAVIWQQGGYITQEEFLANLRSLSLSQLQLQQAAARAMAAMLAMPAAQSSASHQQHEKVSECESSEAAGVSNPPEKLSESLSDRKVENEDEASPIEQHICSHETEDADEHIIPESAAEADDIEINQIRDSATMEAVNIAEAGIPQINEAATVVEPEKPKPDVPLKVILRIRLMDGDAISQEFEPCDTLWEVKAFVDANRTDGNAAYNFAVPFPRKIFSASEYEKELVELDLGCRATIMLVPNSGKSPKREMKAATGQTKGGGIGRWLSYLNPFSYLGGPSTSSSSSAAATAASSNAAANSPWQYAPRGLGQVVKDEGGGKARSNEKGWGVQGNVHTLRRSEDDDDILKRGNAYWNGNSTQFGGDDKK